MTQAEAQTPEGKSLISLGDVVAYQGEPRVTDEQLAKALGYTRSRKLRELIGRYASELQTYGPLINTAGISHLRVQNSSKRRGRPRSPIYLLNELQAIVISSVSDAPKAPDVRRSLAETFVAWRRGNAPKSLSRGARQRENRVRYWKMQLAAAVNALDGLGVDTAAINMKTVTEYARRINGDARSKKLAAA